MFQNIYSHLCGTSHLGGSRISKTRKGEYKWHADAQKHTRTQSCSKDIQFYLVPTETDILRRQQGSLSLEFAMRLGRPREYWKRPAR